MAALKGSKTAQNLKDAFAGESQANRRYLYFAQKADVEGYNDVSAVFRSTAEGETGHAHGHLEYLEEVGDPATGKPIGGTSDNLKATIAEVRLSPWRLLYKPGPGEMANLNLYESARQFSEGANSLDDAAAALRDAMHDPNVDKAQLQKLLEHLDETFKNFHVAEDKLRTAVQQ